MIVPRFKRGLVPSSAWKDPSPSSAAGFVVVLHPLTGKAEGSASQEAGPSAITISVKALLRDQAGNNYVFQMAMSPTLRSFFVASTGPNFWAR